MVNIPNSVTYLLPKLKSGYAIYGEHLQRYLFNNDFVKVSDLKNKISDLFTLSQNEVKEIVKFITENSEVKF